MNNKVRTVNIESLLFLDIETVSRNKELDLEGEEYDLFAWKQRDRDTDRLKINTELELLYTTKAALSPVFNRIVCVTVAYVRGTTVYYKAITGHEKDILEEVYSILNSENWMPCGYNITNFDMPVMRLKAYQSKVETILKDTLSDSGKKPWDMSKYFLDLMDVFRGTIFSNMSLEEACYLSGIPSPKTTIKGHEVTRTFYRAENGLETIANYCNADTIACVKLVAQMKGMDISLLNYVDRTGVQKKEVVDNRTTLEKLYDNNGFTADIKEELTVALRKKRMTKKDRENIFTILRGVLVRTDFENKDQDSKAKIKEKEDSINEFISTL
ncbi:3'-5' exonuclease pol-B [Cellulophaga phage phi17:2_18]|uniref:3'-5' exonuclease pol-B n=2 Tax=Lightbulbvirus Cba172 TaxID=1918525 RepID=R9ZZJ6_9CAUD|nr:3'-5' exonuclease [Cellulophaga phage phi17:2]AGO47697.1 3'-5' exonuclease pol-B [Cellulophaga phage phi17:2]ALO80567.1 3'-5' exonuclease pol-B [Cellulophaga phage phi17:2_18]